MCRNRPPGRRQADWTVEATRHRDALAALDRRREGNSYRQIAVFLYGQKAVQDDWRSPDQAMKNRVIRSVKRGVRMVNGGYRRLLT
ncbi:MAG: DNA -binding domain-containing protein [Alphaproteobacteria bacterium]